MATGIVVLMVQSCRQISAFAAILFYFLDTGHNLERRGTLKPKGIYSP